MSNRGQVADLFLYCPMAGIALLEQHPNSFSVAFGGLLAQLAKLPILTPNPAVVVKIIRPSPQRMPITTRNSAKKPMIFAGFMGGIWQLIFDITKQLFRLIFSAIIYDIKALGAV